MEKINILIFDSHQGSKIEKAIKEVLGDSVHISLSKEQNVLYDTLFISGQKAFFNQNIVSEFRKNWGKEKALVIAVSNYENYFLECFSYCDFCIEKKKLLFPIKDPNMKNFLRYLPDRNQIENSPVIWRSSHRKVLVLPFISERERRFVRRKRIITVFFIIVTIIIFFLFKMNFFDFYSVFTQ